MSTGTTSNALLCAALLYFSHFVACTSLILNSQTFANSL